MLDVTNVARRISSAMLQWISTEHANFSQIQSIVHLFDKIYT
jgi:hypothetical protein